MPLFYFSQSTDLHLLILAEINKILKKYQQYQQNLKKIIIAHTFCEVYHSIPKDFFIDSKRIKMEITEKMQFRNGACN